MKRSVIILFFSIFTGSFLNAADPHANPVANFEVSNLCFGNVSSFINTSTVHQTVTAYKWTIWQMGNSTPIFTASTTNINFQFPVKTTYTVELFVTDYASAIDFHTDSIVRTIIIDSVPVANFGYQNCQGRFTNLSACCNSFLWDFGDATPTSTLTSPAHTYSVITSYTVTLIAGNGIMSDTIKQVVIPFADIITANFTVSTIGDTMVFGTTDIQTFDDTLRAYFWDWEWDFGDGSHIDTTGVGGWQVKHYYQRYENDSIYKVTLVLKDLCFTAVKEQYVRIKGTGRKVIGTHVYPSPVVHGYLNVESEDLNDLKEIKIVDCLGRRLDDLVPSPSRFGYYIYIGHIPAGPYIVQLVFSDHIENHKIIKE